tara:strand:+ start:83 stop:451 length:369 start_codon:yes stop_codon:yes gene_type:complete
MSSRYHIYPVLKQGKYYYQWGDNIGFYPTPTEVKSFRVHYVKKPKTLVQGSTPTSDSYASTPEISQEHHDSLVAYATYQIMMRIDPQKAMVWKQEWLELFDKAVSSSKVVRDEVVHSPYTDI